MCNCFNGVRLCLRHWIVQRTTQNPCPPVADTWKEKDKKQKKSQIVTRAEKAGPAGDRWREGGDLMVQAG